MTYYEEDRARIRSTLSNEQHHYVLALERIACAAYHVWAHAPYGTRKVHLDDLYDALATVDFMEGDSERDSDKL